MKELHTHLVAQEKKISEWTDFEYSDNNQFIQFPDAQSIRFDHQVNRFSNCQFDERVEINNAVSDGREFQHCVFLDEVIITNLSGLVKFIDCVFESNLDVTTIHYKELQIEECEIKKQLIVKSELSLHSKENTVASLIANGGNLRVEDDVSTFGNFEVTTLGESVFEGTKFKGAVNIKNAGQVTLNRVESSSLKFGTIEAGNFNDFIRPKDSESNIFIEDVKSLTIDNVPAKSLVFQLTKKFQSISIINSEFDQLVFSNCRNRDGNSHFEVTNVKVHRSLEIQNCRIPSAKFDTVRLRSANIKLSDSDIENWTFHLVDWSRGHKVSLHRSRGAASEFLEMRNFYRILKHKSIEDGNSIDAGYFKANELDFHYKYIKNEAKEFIKEFGYTKFLRDDLFSEWFILFTNKIFSGFGDNVWRPLVIGLFGFHLILFNLYNLSPNDFDFIPFYLNPTNINGEATLTGIVKFLEYFSPIHKASSGEVGNSWTALFDLIMRISSSYFIFYILRASRKFAK